MKMGHSAVVSNYTTHHIVITLCLTTPDWHVNSRPASRGHFLIMSARFSFAKLVLGHCLMKVGQGEISSGLS